MNKTKNVDWSGRRRQIPSIRSVDFYRWFVLSGILGICVFFALLHMLWRPLAGFEAPPGPLGLHCRFWIESLIHYWIPSWFARDVIYYKAMLLYWQKTGESSSIYGRLFIAGLGSILPSCFLGWLYLIPRDGLVFLRGATRYEGRQAVRKLNRQLKEENLKAVDHEISPGIPYPGSKWTRHVLMTGGVGAGKSSAFKPLIKKIIRKDERLILFDPKGDFTKAFARPTILAPWDSRSCSWDIGKDMRNIGDMRRFAASMIKDATDPMWSNAARQIEVGIMRYLRNTKGEQWGWKELAAGLSNPARDLLPIMEQHHPEAVRAVEKFSVTTHGILINLASYCSAIYDLADAWGDMPKEKRISFVEWTKGDPKKNRQIILQGHGGYPEVTHAYVQGILGVIAGMVSGVELDDDPRRKIWICGDEAPEMGKVPIRQLFSMGRSRGVRCFLICQDLVQLEEIYGKDFIKALLSMSGTLLVGKVGPGETAETLANAIGGREVERRNISVTTPVGGGVGSVSVSYSRENIPLYKASELGSRLGSNIKKGGVVMALVTEGNAYEIFFPFEDFPDRRPAHIPSNWAKPRIRRPVMPVASEAVEEHPFHD